MAKPCIAEPITDRVSLFRIALDLLGAARLSDRLGEPQTTLRAWASGKSAPDDQSTGRTVAALRVTYSASFSDELIMCAKVARSKYLKDYIARRRRDEPEFAAKQREWNAKHRRRNRLKRREEQRRRDRARMAAMTPEQREERLLEKRDARAAMTPEQKQAERILAAARREAFMSELSQSPAALRAYRRRTMLAQRRWRAKLAHGLMITELARLESFE